MAKKDMAAVAATLNTDMKKITEKANETMAKVEPPTKKEPLKPFKKPASDYYRLDLVKRQTVAKEKGKGNKIMIEDIETDYRTYIDSVRGTMSITAYIQSLLDKDMKAKKSK